VKDTSWGEIGGGRSDQGGARLGLLVLIGLQGGDNWVKWQNPWARKTVSQKTADHINEKTTEVAPALVKKTGLSARLNNKWEARWNKGQDNKPARFVFGGSAIEGW